MFILLDEQRNPTAALDAIRKINKHSKRKEAAFEIIKPLVTLQDGQVEQAYELLLDAAWDNSESKVSFFAQALLAMVSYWVDPEGTSSEINSSCSFRCFS